MGICAPWQEVGHMATCSWRSGNRVSRWVAKRRIDFGGDSWLRTLSFISSIFSISFIVYLMHQHQFYALGHCGQSTWMYSLTSKLRLSKHFKLSAAFPTKDMLTIPAGRNLLNCPVLYLYFLTTKTYILLVIYVHVLLFLQAICSKIM